MGTGVPRIHSKKPDQESGYDWIRMSGWSSSSYQSGRDTEAETDIYMERKAAMFWASTCGLLASH